MKLSTNMNKSPRQRTRCEMTLGTPFHPAVMMVHNAIHVSDLAMINTPNLGITFQWNVQNMAGDAMTLGMVSRHHIGRVTEMSPSTSSMASPVNGITGSTSSVHCRGVQLGPGRRDDTTCVMSSRTSPNCSLESPERGTL